MTELILTTPEALYDLTMRVLSDFAAQQDTAALSDWMTTKETSEYLRMSEYSIREKVKDKTIPHGRAGSKLLFSKRALDEWVADGAFV